MGQWQNVTTGTNSGISFNSGNVAIGAATVSGAGLKVSGDVSGAGMVVSSQSFMPTGTSKNSYSLLYKQRIYIPKGTHSLNGSVNLYKYAPAGTGSVRFQIGASTFDVNAPSDDPNSFVDNLDLDVSAFEGTFQTLEILGQADNTAQGIIIQGYTLTIKN